MTLSTKGRYAMIALTDLARQPGRRLVSLAEIAERQDISLAYLEQLFVKLRRASVVESVRGPGGGYRLARPVEEIRIAEVLAAVDEGMDALSRGGGASGAAGAPASAFELRIRMADGRLRTFVGPQAWPAGTAVTVRGDRLEATPGPSEMPAASPWPAVPPAARTGKVYGTP